MSSSNLDSQPSLLARVGSTVTWVRNFVVNSFFILLLLVVIAAVVTSCGPTMQVPQNSALVLNPQGVIVENQRLPDPFTNLVSPGSVAQETELADILHAIEQAATDSRINMLVLKLDQLDWVAPAHAQRIGEAIQQFKEHNKKVVSFAHYYSQIGYQIATFADALYLHPMGQVVLTGFGNLNLYINELLNKLNVTVHVFRVGDYKAAVEPYTRNDMSAEARLANETLYEDLWQTTLEVIARNRSLEATALEEYANQLDQKVKATHGDMARAALEAHLVDELLTADQARVRIGDDVGFNPDGEINGISFLDYLAATDSEPFQSGTPSDANAPQIALIMADGVITAADNGSSNVVAADPTIELIRRARRDDNIKAIVLRVDSPGGGQFASELIRQELELAQVEGKPLVASFGATAASGGYWISATADHIVAEPTTITGSIGIFAIATTYEQSLASIGVNADGVGTTDLTLGMSSVGGLSEKVASIYQAQVAHGYAQFVELVARGRNLEVSNVEKIAQGRVWSGATAKELGLVDQLGGLQTAIAEAAVLADLENYQVMRLREEIDPRDALIAELFSAQTSQTRTKAPNVLWQQLRAGFNVLSSFDDPRDMYAFCQVCGLSSNFKVR